MEKRPWFRDALQWTAIIVAGGAFLFLLEVPVARPWVIGAVMALMILTIGRILYGLAGQERPFDRKSAESLALPVGMICLLTHMLWDRPLLQVIGLILILGASARAWHKDRRVSDSSGTITR